VLDALRTEAALQVGARSSRRAPGPDSSRQA
jgi:hypothetical protein